MDTAGVGSHRESAWLGTASWSRDGASTRASREIEDGGSRQSSHDLLKAMLDERNVPVLLMNRGGVLVAWNDSLARYLAGSRSLVNRSGRLTMALGGAALDEAYLRRHAKAPRDDSRRAGVLSLEIPTHGCEPRLFCEARRIAADGMELWLLSFYRTGGWRRPRVEALQDLLGLTPAESRLVAALFATAAGLEAAAAACGVKRETARSQLRSVFQKCGVRSQVELAKLVALGPFQQA